MRDIAAKAIAVTRQFQSFLLPTTEQQAADVDRYAALVGASIGGLTGVLDLRERLAQTVVGAPLLQATLTFLAIDAQKAAATFRAYLLPLTEGEAANVDRYAAAVEASLAGLSGVLELRQSALEGARAPLSQQLISQLAQEAQQTAATFRSYLLPLSEQEAGDTQRYAAAVESSVGVLKNLGELSAEAFATYQSPSDAQIRRLAMDAQRIARGFADAARVMGSEASVEAGALGEATQKVMGGVIETQRAIEGLTSGITLEPKDLALFKANSFALYDVLEEIGARAVALPAANVAAIQSAATAFVAQTEALAAFERAPQVALMPALQTMAAPVQPLAFASAATTAASGAAMGGGQAAGNSTVINIQPGAVVVNPSRAMDERAVANYVIGELGRRTNGRL